VVGPRTSHSQALCVPCPQGSFSSGGQVKAAGSTLEPRCRASSNRTHHQRNWPGSLLKVNGLCTQQQQQQSDPAQNSPKHHCVEARIGLEGKHMPDLHPIEEKSFSKVHQAV